MNYYVKINVLQLNFDCVAMDIMAFDPKNLINLSNPKRSHMKTTNGEVVKVDGAGSVEVSP